MLPRSVPFFSLLTLAVLGGAQSGGAQSPPRGQVPAQKGPLVGDTAPELNLSSWIQRPEGAPVKLSEMKGKVVLITTFAYNCDTCLKAGIPVAVELRAANKDRGLEVISITLPSQTDKTLAVMKEKHVEHAVAGESPSGGACPYVKIPPNPITYYFLIGRDGDVVRRGSPSTDLKGCLEAVGRALNQPAGRAVPLKLHPSLAKAAHAFQAGSFEDSRRLAQKAAASGAKAKTSDAQAAASDAAYLLRRIDETSASLLKDLEAAASQKDAVKFTAARDDLKRGFGKGAAAEKARPIVEEAEKDHDFAAQVRLASSYLELSRSRPVLFPVASDASCQAYAQTLRKFLKESPPAALRASVQDLLDRFEKKG